MSNKAIANSLIGVVAASIVGGVLEANDKYFMLVGLGMLAFSIIAAVRLYKTPTTS